MNFGFEQYEALAEAMRTSKGKVSINDHPDIRAAFDGFEMMALDIKYSVGNAQQKPGAGRELVIMNWEPSSVGLLF